MPITITATTIDHRQRPSADVPVPGDVVDIMLWRLAFDVAVEHQRGPDGDCTNLRCTRERGLCTATRQAQRALHLARCQPVPTPPAPSRHVPPNYPPATAVGRAAVPRPNAGRFTGWFTSAASAASAATAVNRGRPHHYLPQRTPGAALAAA